MRHVKHNPSKEPVRLFKSDFLESFTHISPVTIVVIWLPVALIFFYFAIQNQAAFASPVLIITALVIGLFLWTLSEYLLHRFLLHFPVRNDWQERISFLFHGVHHAQPGIKTRLVMPPPVSIPLALVFYFFFWLILEKMLTAPHWVAPVFAGFIMGYILYDLTHYATHHIPMKFRYYKFLKRYHMLHHAKTPDQRFGVTSPVWDMVFGTYQGLK